LPEQPGPIVRPAREEDARAVAEAIYLTSPEGFDLFGGRGGRALRLIEAAFARPGSDCSREAVTVAELDGEVAGAMSAFPAEEGDARRRTFLLLALRRRPPWRWWRVVRVARHGASFRRRGVAAALLDEAERAARERGLSAVSLDTRSSNSAARALYEGRGYDVHVQVAASRPIPALVGYVKRLG